MMKTMKVILPSLVIAAAGISAHGDLFFDGSTGFSCVKSVGKVRCEKTKDALVLTDIRRDLEIQCDIVGVEPAKVESFDFRYRATGATPQPKAGGSFATTAWAEMKDPVAVEEIHAHAGIDIGGTLIGMHLRRVAVPVRLSLDAIGNARILCARTRPKYIGGCRAKYE